MTPAISVHVCERMSAVRVCASAATAAATFVCRLLLVSRVSVSRVAPLPDLILTEKQAQCKQRPRRASLHRALRRPSSGTFMANGTSSVFTKYPASPFAPLGSRSYCPPATPNRSLLCCVPALGFAWTRLIAGS